MEAEDSFVLHNPQKRLARILWAIVLGCSLLALGLWLFVGPRFGVWGGPVIIAALVLIPALVCQFVMVPKVERIFDRMRRGTCLARWPYAADEWARWRKLSPRKAADDTPVAFIDRDAVYFEGVLDCWSLSFNFWLDEVSIVAEPVPSLRVTHAWDAGRHGIRRRTTLIPIPDGRSEEATQVVAELERSSIARG